MDILTKKQRFKLIQLLKEDLGLTDKLTLGLNNAGGQTINGTNDKIWLVIRYKGTPSQTLEQITVSVS